MEFFQRDEAPFVMFFRKLIQSVIICSADSWRSCDVMASLLCGGRLVLEC
jgi:hypothetical protein